MKDFPRLMRRLVTLCLTCCWGVVNAQSLPYPAPRFPDLPTAVTREELVAAASTFVTRKGAGMLPGYEIRPGQKALILATSMYDPRIIDAVAQAVHDAGGSADIFQGDITDIIGTSLGNRDWGYLENPIFLFINSQQEYLNRLVLGGGVKPQEVPKLVAFKNYDIVIGGDSSTPRGLPFRWEELPWQRPDQLLATAKFGLPREVVDQMYALAWDQLKQARKVHMTDPEGTDISWNLPAYISEIEKPPRFWREFMCMPERLKGNGLESAKSMQAVDFNGVVAGTINHVGAYPQIKVFIKHNRVQKVEGGGRFGDEFRKVLAQYENTSWPGDQPKPGFGWIEECAVGVIPSEVRTRGAMSYPTGTIRERRRSGVFHWAFGGQSASEVEAALREQGLPDGHFEVHNYFGTMTLETKDGKKILFADKGRMTVLDDPRLRELAAHYGDPDVLLKERWIPPMPGINVPGDYMRDYGADPVSWISNEYDRFFTKH